MENTSRAYQICMTGLIGIATIQVGTVAAEPVLRSSCNVSVETYSSPKRAAVPAGTIFYTCPDEGSAVDRQIRIPANVRLVGEVGEWYEYEFRAGTPVYARKTGTAGKPSAGGTVAGVQGPSAPTGAGSGAAAATRGDAKPGANELLPVPVLPDVDVAGVRLGGSLAEAKAAMQRANSALIFEPVNERTDRGSVFWSGVVAATQEEDDIFVVFADHDDKVWYVWRHKTYQNGPRFQLSEFFESALKKYGPASEEHPKAGWLRWEYDASGRQVKITTGMMPPCLHSELAPWVQWRSQIWKGGLVLTVDGDLPPTCGRQILMQSTDVSDGLSDGYTVKIIDGIAGRNFAAHERERLKREHARKVEEEKAKSQKIEL